tara:strand:+ start:95 stop:1099 length:1005 start_codon:yes stop_codon:yes gene_type:complete
MSQKVETIEYKNIQIVRKNKDMDKKRHGKDWWTEHKAIEAFKHSELDENRARWWNEIVSNTPIRSMTIHINGSGDSGGIDEVYLYDKFGDEIEADYQVHHFKLMQTDFDYEKWLEDKDSVHHGGVNQSSPEGQESVTYALNQTDAKMNVKAFNSLLEDGWQIAATTHSGWREYLKDVTLYKKTGKKGYWSTDDSVYNIHFPKINQFQYIGNERCENVISKFLNTLYYGILPGGWEINEGSYNTLTVESHKPKEGEYGYADGLSFPTITIEHTYYREETDNYTVESHLFAEKIAQIQKEINSSGDSLVFNLDTKKGTEDFYDFVEKLNDLKYNWN